MHYGLWVLEHVNTGWSTLDCSSMLILCYTPAPDNRPPPLPPSQCGTSRLPCRLCGDRPICGLHGLPGSPSDASRPLSSNDCRAAPSACPISHRRWQVRPDISPALADKTRHLTLRPDISPVLAGKTRHLTRAVRCNVRHLTRIRR